MGECRFTSTDHCSDGQRIIIRVAVYAESKATLSNTSPGGYMRKTSTDIIEVQRRLCPIQQQLYHRLWVLF